MILYNLKNKLGCAICFVIALVILFCTYYVLFELEVQKGNEYVACLINDYEANANNDTAMFVYESSEYCILDSRTGFYYRGVREQEPIGFMKFNGLFYKDKQCELYSFVEDKDNMFLCYDFHDAFSGAKTYYRDDLAFPEISLEMVEKIELFKSNRKLILEEYMNDIEADLLVVDKKTIKNILSVFERAKKSSVLGQYIVTDLDSEKLLSIVNEKNKEIFINSGHFYVVATFNNYPREFCNLLGEISIS